jgi:hypothetical protein
VLHALTFAPGLIVRATVGSNYFIRCSRGRLNKDSILVNVNAIQSPHTKLTVACVIGIY